MELTAASRSRSRKARSLNIAFTSAWQSSNVPSTATACTLGSVAVVIMRRCTSEMRPCGKSTTASTRSSRGRPRWPPRRCRPRWRHDGHALAAGGQHAVHQAGQQLHGHVLEGQRRPVEQLQHPQAAVDLHQRRHRRVAEAGVGVARERDQLGARDRAAGERLQQGDGDLGERLAGEARDRLGRNLRPGLRHVEPAVAREPRQQRILEGELRGLASGADVVQRMGLSV